MPCPAPYGLGMATNGVRRAADLARGPFSPQTWRSTGYLLGSFPVGIISLILMGVGMSLSLALWPIVIGFLIWLGRAYIALRLAHFERLRVTLVRHEAIAPPRRAPLEGKLLRRVWTVTKSFTAWKEFFYLFLVLPITGIIGFAFAVSLWAVALAGVTLPVWFWFLPDHRAPILYTGEDRWAWEVTTLSQALVATAVGIGLSFVFSWILRGIAALNARIAVAFLGPSRTAELEQRVGELAASRAGAIDVQANELRRIERDLHDGTQARLVSLAMNLGMAKQKLAKDPERAATLLDEAHGEAKTVIAELRQIVRGIAPPILTDRGLDAAVSALTASCPIPVEVKVDVSQRPPAAVEACVYFVVAESIANIVKHSRASEAQVRIELRSELLIIDVTDNGVGGARIAAGSGLTGLRQRLEGLDGTLSVISPPGGPTQLHAEVPCASS